MLSPSHHNMDRRWKPNVELAPNCPRCDSSNTKFCYYNNYSLSQPRYFCKGCRRYWTKGGSLRNVPVGGGCRKNRRGKSSVRLSCGAAPQGNRHRLPGPIVRPDLMLNDMARSDVDATALATGDGGSVIDLEVLYAKYLNQCPVQIKPADPAVPESQVAEINPETLISVGTSTSESSSCNQVPVQPPNQQVSWECQSIIAQPMEKEALLDHSYSITGVSNLSVELSNPLALPIMEPVNNYISNLDCPSSSNLGYEEFESVSVVGSMNHQQSLVNDEYWSSLDYLCLEAFYRS